MCPHHPSCCAIAFKSYKKHLYCKKSATKILQKAPLFLHHKFNLSLKSNSSSLLKHGPYHIFYPSMIGKTAHTVTIYQQQCKSTIASTEMYCVFGFIHRRLLLYVIATTHKIRIFYFFYFISIIKFQP